ncbi:hypothetical protein WME99_44610 [Sorangium sp. So ce136]|uniref:hypothetical protein n=1 Tax=Sorangium sp. So ce136 TaxID=3133284 RepID=UPI003EFF0F5A
MQPVPPPRRFLGYDRADDLDAIAEGVLAEEAETLSLPVAPVAPGHVLELAYDNCGLFTAT